MKKFLRSPNSKFLVLILVLLLGCNKKKELGFLGDIEVGKYEITQFREYPNGSKDTLHWEAYGPSYPSSIKRYFFYVHDTSGFQTTWELFKTGVLFDYRFQTESWSATFSCTYTDIQKDHIELDYDYYENNMPIGTDSASGTMVFKRIQ